MKVFVVHVYDAAGQLHDYSVHGTIEGAVRRAATNVVFGNFKETDETLIDRVVAAASKESGTGRWHVSCEAWRAHVDAMQLSEDLLGIDAVETARKLCEAATPPPWRAVGSKPPHVVYVHAAGVTPYVAKLHDSANGAANAAFVVAARAFVPALLDEIERLRAAIRLVPIDSDDAGHTCATHDPSCCDPCMQLETELWNAVNDYAISVGGDPSRHVHGNTPRMQAVVAVVRVVERWRARPQIDARAHETLVKTARRLRTALIDTRGFLRGFAGRPELGRGAQDLLDEAVMLDRVLDETKESR